MNKEEFEKLWAETESAPKLREVKRVGAEKITHDLSMVKLIERMELTAEASLRQGQITKSAFDELIASITSLKNVLNKVDPNKRL